MLRKLLRALKSPAFPRWTPLYRDPFIWEGVYSHYRDVKESGPGFSGDYWINAIERQTSQAWEALRSEHGRIPASIPSYHAFFAQVVALLHQWHQRLRVLDFGGGMGASYVNMRRCVGQDLILDYWVVDNERSCQAAAKLAAADTSVHFSSTVPPDLGKIDLLLLSGVLQFVEDYPGLLEMLASHKPEFLMFGFLPSGEEIPTFASAQRNVPGSTIPVWFFNLSEVCGLMKKLGYSLAFKAPYDRRFNMDNFPETHRLHYQCNLLFQRDEP